MQKSLVSQQPGKENFKKKGEAKSARAEESSSNSKSGCEEEVIQLATRKPNVLIGRFLEIFVWPFL